MVHCYSSSHRITWTLCMCVEGLCSIFFCATSNRFVWVLPLLLPLPVTSWSDSSVLLLRRMSLGVRERGWSSTDTGTGSCDPGDASQGRDGALSSKTLYRGTRAINHEFTAVCCCYYCSLHKSKMLFVLRFSPKDLPVQKLTVLSNFLGTF